MHGEQGFFLGGELIVPAAGTVAVIGGSLLGGVTDGIKQYLKPLSRVRKKYSATDTPYLPQVKVGLHRVKVSFSAHLLTQWELT